MDYDHAVISIMPLIYESHPMQAPLQAKNDYDAAQTDTGRTVEQKRVLSDNRPEAVAQRKLAEMMNNSPRVLQQRALSDAIPNSPRMVAQRHEMNALCGATVKPQGDGAMLAEASPAQREEKTNNTGLPNQLKSGIESLSGMSMDHVKVHYSSEKPAQLQAHAYAQGSEIHLGAGQERHLPHEAWHVVQQAQGRVRPTLQMKAGAVNDDPSLEKEADMMGKKAAQFEGDHVAKLAHQGPCSMRQAPFLEGLRSMHHGATVQLMWSADGFKEKIEELAPKERLSSLFFKKSVYVDNPEFDNLVTLLRLYEDFGDENTVDVRQSKTELLHEMEREVYTWYGSHRAQETPAGRTQDPYQSVMIQQLLKQIETERQTLVVEIVNNKDEIWVPGLENMADRDRNQPQELWRKLISNKGQLRISKNAPEADKARVYSNYLQLISGSYGRGLLERASAGNKQQPQHVITIDPARTGGPEARAYDAINAHRYLAHDHPLSNASINPARQVTLTHSEVSKSRKGSGSGSVIPYSPQADGYFALGNDYDPLAGVGSLELMPSFIVLGHELGHAERQQHGKSTVRFQSAFHQTEEGHTWHNLEEQAVITRTENALRDEHGLGARKFHRGVPI